MIDENVARPLGEEDGPGATTERDNTPEDTTESAENPILKAALEYAAQGWPVFPCRQDKRPYTPHGFHDAILDPLKIKQWWRRWPDALIGSPTGEISGHDVIDIDIKNGVDGKASFDELQRKYGPFPQTRIARTQSGGYHVYFKHEPGVKNSAGKLGPGLDVRGDGGYVILPGSPGYTWYRDRPIAKATAALIQLLTKKSPPRSETTPAMLPTGDGQAVLAEALAEMGRATVGNRNDTLFKQVIRLRKLETRGELPENAMAQLREAAKLTGLDEAGIEATIQSGMKPPEWEADIDYLAALPPLEYERIRKAEAKRLGIRPSVLDAAVKATRQDVEAEKALPFAVVTPWPSEVDPAVLLTELAATVRRFVVCSQEIADTVALWSAMTYVMDAVNVAPLLIITAPERQCGKTVLLSLIGRLAARAIAASNISPSSLFRAIEKWTPTLLLDECDAFLKENEALRGLINSGHTRDSAFTLRTVGDEFEPTRFSTWGAKVLCGIGRLPGTLEDRAIILELRRKLPGERVERMGQAEPGLFNALRSKLARFGADFQEQVREARPAVLERLTDRQMDNWGSLLQIAMAADGGWPERCTTTALALSGKAEAGPAIGTELLEGIRAAFKSAKTDRLDTAGLIMALCADAEAPWRTFNRGQPITPRQIATYLKGYGIVSRTIRIAKGNTPKGYYLESFKDAFKRYAPEKDIFS